MDQNLSSRTLPINTHGSSCPPHHSSIKYQPHQTNSASSNPIQPTLFSFSTSSLCCVERSVTCLLSLSFKAAIANMTVTAVPTVKDGCLMVRGKVVLTRVPGNIVVSPVGTATGSAFLGATSTTPTSRHVFTLGILR